MSWKVANYNSNKSKESTLKEGMNTLYSLLLRSYLKLRIRFWVPCSESEV